MFKKSVVAVALVVSSLSFGAEKFNPFGDQFDRTEEMYEKVTSNYSSDDNYTSSSSNYSSKGSSKKSSKGSSKSSNFDFKGSRTNNKGAKFEGKEPKGPIYTGDENKPKHHDPKTQFEHIDTEEEINKMNRELDRKQYKANSFYQNDCIIN